jgi:LuxR family transcriptional regulator, maltose regulon positive regulatory protein
MASQLVATKLFVPQRRGNVVERRRLNALLRRGADARLTLISAPAGFGKTTLVAGWLKTRPTDGRVTAWLSLDQTDNEPGPFWTHVVAALQKAMTEAGMAAFEIPPTAPPSGDLELTSIVNALATLDGEVELVLDDYHVIDHPEIQTGMAFLLEHLPPQVHIVITTRADPALPLARLRARGELVEIRSADLRFTADEATSYLNGMIGLSLAASDIAALEDRTEGWIAALQLAALSMQGRNDVSGFIAGFAGTDRYVFDYLVEEVLERQSEGVRSFLLDTCFLDRLSGPLCDAVTLRSDSAAMLEQLHRANLFLVPLDDRREWYRYHHLFADVLTTQVSADRSDELLVRHRRASDWYEATGARGEAIRHALAAEDMERAALLMELAIPALQKNRGEATIRSWAKLLPPELVRTRPVLGIGLVGGLMSSGDFESIEPRLRDVEWGLRTLADAGDAAASGVAFADAAEVLRLPGAIELYRAALAQVRGDVPAAIVHAERVLELAPLDDHVGRAAGSSFLGITHWSQGNLEAARLAWTEGRNGLARVGHISDVLGVSIALADINLAQGRLRAAAQIFEEALRLATTPDGSVLRGTADIHAGLAAVCRERNDLPAAHQHLTKSQELGERAGLPQHPYRWRVAMAHVLQDQGELARAADLMEEARQLYVGDFFPMVRPVTAMRARIWIAQGRLGEALGWQHETGLSADDDLNYLREFEHITLARLLLAEANDQVDRMPAVRRLLDRLLEAAERGERRGSVVEISILSAVACRQDVDAALVPLERALVLAAPEGYVRLFVNEGGPMELLLKAAVKRGIAPAYARQLLAAFTPRMTTPQRHADQIEALSERELDVLRLLKTELGGPDIARELSVSENTMRTHTKNIYDKLGVNSRRAAVRRAEELDLLTHKTR